MAGYRVGDAPIMRSLCCRLCLLSITMIWAGTEAMADTPSRLGDSRTVPSRQEPGPMPIQPAAAATPPSSEKLATTAGPPSLELLKLPAGAIVVVCEKVSDALRLVPQVVVLRPQDYQKLIQQIEQLKHQTEADRPVNPSSCKLTGHVEGEWVYLRAEFGFKTDRPRSTVNLGCQSGSPTAATLDGSQAALQKGDDGFLLPVETPGVHQGVMDLMLRLSQRGIKGTDRMFELDLPRAAITTLERLDLPAGISEVKLVGSRSLRTTRVEPQHSRLEHVPLSDRTLTLAWKGPAAPAPKGPAVREAIGSIVVRVNESQVFTEASFTLQVLSGEAEEWRIQLPALPDDARLEIKIPQQEEQRIQGIVQPSGTGGLTPRRSPATGGLTPRRSPVTGELTRRRSPNQQNSVVTIRLKEPSTEPLHPVLRIHRSRPAGALAVGPFIVLDSLTQKGEIEIHAPDDLRVRYQPAPEVTQREISEDQRGQDVRAVFGYWNIPSLGALTQPRASLPPLLTLQLEAIKGAVETHVTQNLRLEGDGERGLAWHLSTRLDVTPFRTAVDSLEVSLPAGYEYDKGRGAAPADLVEDVILDRSKQSAQIKLAHKQNLPFSVTLTGTYRLPAGQDETSLDLVRPLAWSVEHGVSTARSFFSVLDRGCDLQAALPEAFEFAPRPFRTRAVDNHREPSLSLQPPPQSGSREFSWQGERTPARLDLAWRAHRPDLPVDALVDVTLSGHHGQVRQQLHYQFGALSLNRLLLRVPSEVQAHLKIVEGGVRDTEETKTPGEWAVNIPATAAKEHSLILEYSFALPNAPGQNPSPTSSPRPFTVPLVRAVQATRGETKVRIWCDPSMQPSLAGGSWTELPTEIVPDRDSLPMLVARGGPNSGLRLRLAERALTPLAAAVTERILVHATVREGGMQSYHVRFLLSKLSARHLDLHLPILLSISNLDVRVDGKRVPVHFVDEGGREMEIGKVLRLRVEPDLYHKPVLLEVAYPADTSLMEGSGLWQLMLRPPELPDAVLLGRVRWQVDLPAGWLPISPRGGSIAEQRWGWWGWLPAPRPAWSSSDLEQWLDPDRHGSAEENEPSLVCWQAALGPLALVYAPQRIWLLACSSILLALGLGLFLAPLSRALFWTCVVLFGAAVAVVGVYAPAALPAIAYGSEPGALVLLLAVAAQWIQHQRYRRQVIFMPGFTRLKAGSSLIRGGGNVPRDPSTIDEPPKRPGTSWPESLETPG
jgi:hypothetical protein